MEQKQKGQRYTSLTYADGSSSDDDSEDVYDEDDDDTKEAEDAKHNADEASSATGKRKQSKPRARWNAAPSLASKDVSFDDPALASSSLLPTVPDQNIRASDTLDSVGFSAVFMNKDNDILVTARLKDMTNLLRAIRQNVARVSLPQHARYILLLHALNNHLCNQAYPRTLRPLWIRYRENACKCLRFEVVNRVIDFTRRVLFESTVEGLRNASTVSDFSELVDDLALTEQILEFTATHTVNMWTGPRREYLDRVRLRLDVLLTVVQAATSWMYGSLAALKASKGTGDLFKTRKLWFTAVIHFKRCRDLLATTTASVPLKCEGATEYTPLTHRCKSALQTTTHNVNIESIKEELERAANDKRTWAQKANTAFLDALVQWYSLDDDALGEVVCLQAVILNNGGWTEKALMNLESSRLASVRVPASADSLINKLVVPKLPKREMIDLDRLMIDTLLSRAFHERTCTGTLMRAIRELDETM